MGFHRCGKKNRMVSIGSFSPVPPHHSMDESEVVPGVRSGLNSTPIIYGIIGDGKLINPNPGWGL